MSVFGVEEVGPVPRRGYPTVHDDPGEKFAVGIIKAVAAPNVFTAPGQGAG